MRDISKNEGIARRLSIAFVAIVVVILLALTITILVEPYDPGVLIGASLSGNNQNGGKLTATGDYLFYCRDRQIMRYDRGQNSVTPIYEGEGISHLNPYDGWLYFVQNGRICRIAYYGGEPLQLGTTQKVNALSVNGLWLYYTDEDGILYKIRSDGQKQTALTNGTPRVTAFESANRLVLFTDGRLIYRMNTDGSDCTVLVREASVDRMIYTLDQLFYLTDGQVKTVKSVESGADDGCGFGELRADLFNYDTDSNGRGQIFYLTGQELRLRKLESVQDEKEEDRLLTRVEDMQDLYLLDGDVYFYTASGELFRVYVDESECSVEPVK